MLDSISTNGYLARFKPMERKLSRESVLTSEIYNAFGKKISYPRILKIIKEKGYQATYENFNSLKQQGLLSPRLFLWKMMRERVILRDLTNEKEL
jgi:hypothetical protein